MRFCTISTKSIMCHPSAHATSPDLHEALHKSAASKKHNRFLAMLHLLLRVPFRREITTVTWSRRDSAKLKTILSRGLVGNATHLTTASPLESVGALSAEELNLIYHRGLVSDAVFATLASPLRALARPNSGEIRMRRDIVMKRVVVEDLTNWSEASKSSACASASPARPHSKWLFLGPFSRIFMVWDRERFGSGATRKGRDELRPTYHCSLSGLNAAMRDPPEVEAMIFGPPSAPLIISNMGDRETTEHSPMTK